MESTFDPETEEQFVYLSLSEEFEYKILIGETTTIEEIDLSNVALYVTDRPNECYLTGF